MHSVTTSIRIKPHLRQELSAFSTHCGHGMNWIIEQALAEYLKRHQKKLLIEEAIKDIVLLQDNSDEDAFWGAAYDDSGWVA